MMTLPLVAAARAAKVALLGLGILLGAPPHPGEALQTPQRVVSLVPAATQALHALGAVDRLIGVSSYDDWPDEVANLPRVGALLDPNLEAILALRPDLVITDPAQGALVRQLQAAGIESYEYATDDIAGVFDHLRTLGRRLGMQEQGRRAVAALQAELDALRQDAAGRARVPTMLVFGRRPGTFAELWVNGGVGFLHELMEITGARNLYADVGRQSVRAGMETVLARVPELVIELRLGAEPGSVDAAAIASEWQSLPGFEGVRVRVFTDNWLVIPGPRIGEAARRFADAVRP